MNNKDQKKVDINKKDEKGYTQLMHAACRYSLVTVEELLLAGADPNLQNNQGETALLLVIKMGSSPGPRRLILEALLRAGADIHIPDNEGTTPLEANKVYSNNVDHELLKKYTGIASFNQKKELPPYSVDYVNKKNSGGWTPLMNAAYHYKPIALNDLIRAHADPNLQNNKGETALLLVLKNKKYPAKKDLVLRELLEAGADVHIPDNDGITPLLADILYSNGVHVDLLKEYGAITDINRQDKNGWTPLMHAAGSHSLGSVEWLIKEKAQPNLQNNKGETALLLAIKNSLPGPKTQIVNALIKAGADVHIPDSDGITPLQADKLYAHSEFSDLFERAFKHKQIAVDKATDPLIPKKPHHDNAGDDMPPRAASPVSHEEHTKGKSNYLSGQMLFGSKNPRDKNEQAIRRASDVIQVAIIEERGGYMHDGKAAAATSDDISNPNSLSEYVEQIRDVDAHHLILTAINSGAPDCLNKLLTLGIKSDLVIGHMDDYGDLLLKTTDELCTKNHVSDRQIAGLLDCLLEIEKLAEKTLEEKADSKQVCAHALHKAIDEERLRLNDMSEDKKAIEQFVSMYLPAHSASLKK